MKTEEDEAFDEIARKQGMWGGGFQAKRAMAADKLQEPAQEPHEYDWSMLEAAKESLREHMARIKKLEATLAQLAQEPAAWRVSPRYEDSDGFFDYTDSKDTADTLQTRGWTITPLYEQPPQREWVSLTDKEMQACWDAHMGVEDYSRIVHQAIEAKLKEKNNGT